MTILKTILSKINDYEKIIIHRHVRPDLDAYGSQVGLVEWIKHHFPKKKVLCAGENDPSLNYLAMMDAVEDHDYENALVVICDSANSPRIDDDRYKLGSEIIKIDHHPIVDQYGDINWVDTNASSTSEMIYELIDASEGELTTEVARLIYAGIVGDTGRFLYPSTTNKTFEIASKLVDFSFDRSEIYNNMYEVELSTAKLNGYLLNHLEISDSGISVAKLTQDILNKYKVTSEETSSLVHIYENVKGIKAWVMFIEEDEQIRVRLRSKVQPINEIAAQFNGGGHPLASGATVYSWEEADELILTLNKTFKS